MGAADVEYVSDGSLMTEFVLVQRLYKAAALAASHDPFTCALGGDAAPNAALDGLRSDPRLECLDVGSSSTLGGLANLTAIDQIEGHALPSSASAEDVVLFGAVTPCGGKVVSDGVINAYDFAVLMWAQFRVPPYDTLLDDLSLVPTMQGRDDTHARCGTGEDPAAYAVDTLALNFCGDDDGGGGGDGSSRRRRLDDPSAAQPRDLGAEVMQWAEAPGVGEWTRVRLPAVAHSLELYLHGAAGYTTQDLTYEPVPRANCSEPTNPAACAPQFNADRVVIGFERRADLLAAGGGGAASEASCATIQRASADVLSNGRLALLQTPPAAACAYDVFVWRPHALLLATAAATAAAATAADGDEACAGRLGVRAGSSALDGEGGATQLGLVCAADYGVPPPPAPPSPPSPPPPSAPPSAPPLEPAEYRAAALVTVELAASGSVSDYDEADIADIAASLAAVAGVSASDVQVSVVAASVLIVATVTLPPAPAHVGTGALEQQAWQQAQLDQTADLIGATLGTAEMASAALGIQVEAAPQITGALHAPPPTSPPPAAPPAAAAAPLASPRAPPPALGGVATGGDDATRGMIALGVLAGCAVATAAVALFFLRRSSQHGRGRSPGRARVSARLSSGPAWAVPWPDKLHAPTTLPASLVVGYALEHDMDIKPQFRREGSSRTRPELQRRRSSGRFVQIDDVNLVEPCMGVSSSSAPAGASMISTDRRCSYSATHVVVSSTI